MAEKNISIKNIKINIIKMILKKNTKTKIVVFEMHMLWRGQKQFIAMAHTDKQTDRQ